MTNAIKKDLRAIKKEYNRPRRTLIEDGKEAVFDENAFIEQEVVFVQDKFGYAKLQNLQHLTEILKVLQPITNIILTV